jgi:lipopolysaccharide transport system ATP-binding protein
MSADYSIEIEGLAKRYRLGAAQRSGHLRERLIELASRPWRRSTEAEWVWALRNVSFSVPRGEVVGIIGRNGAGKSTLLKILSRITYPTAGRINVNGRVASLLEVGTGFHEELTGRENIYLNGSILGMRRREIEQRFDAIVDFSGVEQFIDTPIKRYSSGMRLRLGFAVAAHLEPDILIVDEVLAVGDAGFQKKCITAMEGLRGGGRTVLFVSHNMAAVENLCSRGVWIEGGVVKMDAPAADVIKSYLSSYGGEEVTGPELNFDNRIGGGEIRFTRIEYRDAEGGVCAGPRSGEPFVMRLHFSCVKRVPHPSFGFRLFTGMGTLITETAGKHHGVVIPSVEPGEGYLDIEFDGLNLIPGKYSLSLWVTEDSGTPVYDGDVRAAFEVEQADVYGSGRALDSRHGIVYFPQRWTLTQEGERDALAPAKQRHTGSGG